MDTIYLFEFEELELLDIDREKKIIANIKISENEELKFNEPLKFDLTITRKGYKFLFNGNICTSLILQCDRCLEEYFSAINTDFNFLYILNEDVIEYISGSILNLKDLIFGEIYLNIPFKKLCKTNCKGLCAQCGTNLNFANCDCTTDDSMNPFAKLKTIFN